MKTYKKILSFMKENEDLIIEKIEECYKQAFYAGNRSGWNISVEGDIDSVWINGLRSNNTQSVSSWNRESYEIYSCDCNFDVDCGCGSDCECTKDDIYDYIVSDFDSYTEYQQSLDHLEMLILSDEHV